MLARVRPPPLPHQLDVLRRILEGVASHEGKPAPVVVFDLDATLFDNRPRTLEILMEFREDVQADDPELAAALLTLDVDRVHCLLTDTLKECGIYRADLVKEISAFWHERFFTDEYIAFDAPLDGAPEFVRACHESGAVVVYLTGRGIRGRLGGTVAPL